MLQYIVTLVKLNFFRVILCIFGFVTLVVIAPWRLIAGEPVYRDTLIEQRMLSSKSSAGLQRHSLGLVPPQPIISPDGRFIAILALNENTSYPRIESDLCLYDRESGTIVSRTAKVSLAGFTHKGHLLVFAPMGRNGLVLRDLTSKQQHDVNVAIDGTTANKSAQELRISADGRFVVFNSDDSNLVAGDAPGSNDVFVRDTVGEKTECISVTLQGQPANNRSIGAHISADGRFVAFTSQAANLVAVDTKGIVNVFVRDCDAKLTTLISKSKDGVPGNGASRCIDMTPDGQYILFSSDATNLLPASMRPKSNLYVVNRGNNKIIPVKLDKEYGLVNGELLSRDGRFLIFVARNSDQTLAATRRGIDTFTGEIFCYDFDTGKTFCVSEGSAAIQKQSELPFHDNSNPSMSENGRYICFQTRVSNVSPTSSSGTPSYWDTPSLDKWHGAPVVGYAVQIYDRETQKTSTVLLETDLPQEQ